MIDDGLLTTTSADQAELERRVASLYAKELGTGACIAGPAGPARLCECRRCRRRHRLLLPVLLSFNARPTHPSTQALSTRKMTAWSWHVARTHTTSRAAWDSCQRVRPPGSSSPPLGGPCTTLPAHKHAAPRTSAYLLS